MGKGLEQLEDLRDDGIRYARLRWTSLRLSAVDKMSIALSRAFGFLIALVLAFFALAFMLVALALWLGEVMGHLSLGFLVSGGIFLIGGVVIYSVRGCLVVNPLVRYFIDAFFTGKDDDDAQ